MQVLNEAFGMLGGHSRKSKALSFRDTQSGYFRLKLLTFTY
jgi:hypothetical protein